MVSLRNTPLTSLHWTTWPFSAYNSNYVFVLPARGLTKTMPVYPSFNAVFGYQWVLLEMQIRERIRLDGHPSPSLRSYTSPHSRCRRDRLEYYIEFSASAWCHNFKNTLTVSILFGAQELCTLKGPCYPDDASSTAQKDRMKGLVSKT